MVIHAPPTAKHPEARLIPWKVEVEPETVRLFPMLRLVVVAAVPVAVVKFTVERAGTFVNRVIYTF